MVDVPPLTARLEEAPKPSIGVVIVRELALVNDPLKVRELSAARLTALMIVPPVPAVMLAAPPFRLIEVACPAVCG